MIKKLAIAISMSGLVECQTPVDTIPIGVYSNGDIFKVQINKADKVVVGDQFSLKRYDGTRLGFNFDYFDGMPKGIEPRAYFVSLFGAKESNEKSILDARKVIFEKLVEHKDISGKNNIAYYFRYEDGLEKIVVFENDNPTRYLVIETTGGDAMELFNNMRNS